MQDAPKFGLEHQTIVFDRPRNRPIMWIDGVVTMPPGSLIELHDGKHYGTAIVTQVRLLAGYGTVGAQVCLDCEVEDGWWPEQEDGESVSPSDLAPADLIVMDD